MFQFQKVQLKFTANKNNIDSLTFQFQKVQLKFSRTTISWQIIQVSIPKGSIKILA